MIERVCPRCDAGNPSENAFCGQCGAALELHEKSVQPLARSQPAALARRSITIPVQWKQTRKVVALGVATLAAEAAMAWLNRKPQPLARAGSTPQTARVIALGRRVTETWRNGELQQRTEEQIAWLMPDQPRR